VSKLVVFRGDAVEQEVPLTGKTVSIGRDSHNDIVLDDSLKGVSRFHAEIRAEAGKFFIVDVKSRNGVWVNGRRIAERAELALGVPATLGAYELVLEDDASSGEFSVAALHTQHTMVNPPTEADRPSRVTKVAPSPRSFGSLSKNRMLLWSGTAVAVLLIAGVTFALVRSRASRTTQVVNGDLPTPPPEPARLAVPRDIEDTRKRAFREHLAEARKQMDDHDYRGAVRDHLSPVLDVIAQLGAAGAAVDFDAENAETVELKRLADAAKPPVPTKTEPPAPLTAVPQEVETPNIPRRPGELWPDYVARVRSVQIAFAQGRASLDRQEFAAAINQFKTVDAGQRGYPGLDALVTEATTRQRRAVDDALNSGQLSEQDGKLRDALGWYQRALGFDPASTNAREKYGTLLTRMRSDASKLLTRTTTAWKLSNKDAKNRESAVKQLQQVVELTLPGDEVRIMAEKWLEDIKR